MDPRKPGFGAGLIAEQLVLSKQGVPQRLALDSSENDAPSNSFPQSHLRASESEIEELLEERDQQEYIDALNDRCWGEDG